VRVCEEQATNETVANNDFFTQLGGLNGAGWNVCAEGVNLRIR